MGLNGGLGDDQDSGGQVDHSSIDLRIPTPMLLDVQSAYTLHYLPYRIPKNIK